MSEHKCCCGGNEEKKEEVKSCCCGEHEEKKEEVKGCCCGGHEEKHEEERGCCCHSHEEEEHSCCCGGSSDGGCCGGGEKSDKSSFYILLVSVAALVLSFFKVVPIVDPAWLVIILCGKDIFVSAFKSIKKRKISTPILISVAMTASIALEFFYIFGFGHAHDHGSGYIFAAGEIAFLMFLGQYLESRTVKKSKEGVKKLAELLPETAKVECNGEIIEVNARDLMPSDIVVVNPAEKIPADGVVISGTSSVDNSMLTGESQISDVLVGSKVFAGTWNGYGVIRVKVTEKPEDMAVSRLVQLTKEAQGKKAPIARAADKWAGILVPTAALISVLVFMFAFFVLKTDFVNALVRAVSVLVVFCPCALTLATPTAVSATIGAFSKYGVLVKSGSAIEGLAKTKNVAFDKTGTLTHGKLEISDVIANGISEDELFSYLKTAESASEHPIAVAVKNYKSGEMLDAENVSVLSGVGVSCTVSGKKIKVSKLSEFENASEDAVKLEGEGKTVIGLSIDDEIKGYVALSDTLRESSPKAISELEKCGVNCYMLTGDNKACANYVGEKAGVKKVWYSLLPHNKTEIVEQLKQTGITVFVGDGINDTPSIAMADVGISMSVLGTAIATQNADVSLFTEDMTILPWIIKNSKRTLSMIKGNIALAMSINAIAIILSAIGILTPVTGALLHNCTSVLVVGNSCRLLSVKRK